MITGQSRIFIRLVPLYAMLCCLACHESKYLGAGQTLYTANTVKLESSVPITGKQRKEMTRELKALIRPKLNGKLLGFRFKLWVYNIAGTPKGKGLRHWLKTKVGEPPVLASPSLISKNRDVMQNHLENKGYFHDTVISLTRVKDKHLTANYTAHIGPRYIIRNITYPDDSDRMSNTIDTLQRRSLLKKGDFYDLDVIKQERSRIDTRLKNRGFYFFAPDYLVVDLDTTVGDHRVDMFMKIKEETPDAARNEYYINNVVVYANYDIRSDTSLKHAYTTPEGYHIVDTAHYLRPLVFRKTMTFKTGDLYKQNDHNLSLSRLVSLGVFRFVKARFEPASRADSNHKLDAYYYLTPNLKKSLRFEASALTRSDNTTGGELSVNWRHRNAFHGAELFIASVYGGLEQQYVSKGTKVHIQRGGADLNLYIPRIIAPFSLNTAGGYVPKTRIEAAYDLYDQSSEYTLVSSRGSFGYIFKNSATTENQLTILGVNYVRPIRIDSLYQLGLDTNLTLARAIERQLIIGPTYNFNYNSQLKRNHNLNNFYFNGNVDFSNNIVGILSHADINKGKVVSAFGVPLAQYMRFEADFRHYLTLGPNSSLASRVDAGVGIPYGNSSTMPFIKEFFAGGTNDVRAFRSRALGPGSYYAGNPNTTPLLPDQPGDIKMEMNVEYRAKLFSLFRWAIFADAGNVWTLHNDTSRPGAVFTPHFLNDFAVGVGTGLRFDFTILILRVDMAVPIRYPWLPTGSKWNLQKAGDISNWVLNLAIGYPF
ncbi:MAG TPA: BamA/TamA family outer membrane protein [Puia sp.]|jgi:outer membrane protein insertion porin family|nr:BamA/TamA family outer membrane protein [Puia sp.]